LEKVGAANSPAERLAFSRRTKRLFKDALRLRQRSDFSLEIYSSRIERLYKRLVNLRLRTSNDVDVQRLTKCLKKY